MKEEIREKLLSLKDDSYKSFTAPLLPTLDANTIIGVRTPKLRAYAKKVYMHGDYEDFLNDLPHKYYEENTLHVTLVAMLPYERFLAEIERFLPYLDNWGTCDGIRPKFAKQNLDVFASKIEEWLNSAAPYTVRFAILMLMTYYLDEAFDAKYLKLVSHVKSEHYYVNMMIAWYFATALAKKYDETVPYLEKYVLSSWVHNKTIQKAKESYRITPEQKEYLGKLKLPK